MTRAARTAVLAVMILCGAALDSVAQSAVTYRFSFADRAHHLMDVEATFPDLPSGPLHLHMSRSSPGRYALHEFAKNVFDVRITDDLGRPLSVTRPAPHEWTITTHPSTVRVTYRVFGDRVDGTYLGVDTTHAHINMPAAVMWAQGLELRPITVRFDPPAGSGWRVATQLLPGADPLTFSAATLQYLMDSPAEFSAFTTRSFNVADNGRTPLFRLTVHHDGSDAELDGFVRDVERIVREERGVFGELPAYEGNTYTFVADYLPWNRGDAMEHRNSTALTSPGAISTARADLLDSIAHEFFHSWNVERIRPRSLEPFNFDDVNMSGELWLAEGFTNYYGPLAQHRAGVTTLRQFIDEMSDVVDTVINSPARRVRTAVEMSQYASFVDAATSIDPTNTSATYISYYTWGEAIALALDLTLRARTADRITLDDYMRALWEQFGKPGGRLAGYVDRPYTIDDAREMLGTVAGDATFARDFFSLYIQGHDVPDYAALLDRAGLVLVKAAPGRASVGALSLEDGPSGVRVSAAVPFDSPAYRAGIDLDDVIVSAGGTALKSVADLMRLLGAKKPGDMVPVVYLRRGQRATTVVTLAEDPRVRIATAEELKRPLTEAQNRVRTAWLSSRSRNVF
jgi:predicted metalloprotease with PDZ domain